MDASNNTQRSSISNAESQEGIADFWDVHSLADHWDQTQEVNFEVRALRRRRITVEPDLYEQVDAQARRRGIQPETLINLWLAERLVTEGG